MVEAAVGHFGGLDVVVNNAGIGLPRFFGESDPAAIAEQVAVNFRAPILVARFALPHLLTSSGILINVGSAITTLANPALGVYGATKAGLANFTDALRREVRHKGVRVCLVEPGPVETDFFAAVQARATDGRKVLGASPPSDRIYNPVRDRPPKLWAINRGRRPPARIAPPDRPPPPTLIVPEADDLALAVRRRSLSGTPPPVGLGDLRDGGADRARGGEGSVERLGHA